MHVTYLRYKSYQESMVRYLHVLQGTGDRSAENYRPVSSCSVLGARSRKRHHDRGRFVECDGSSSWLDLRRGQVWLLLKVDFVHRAYTRPGNLKPDLSRRPGGHAEMRADRLTCGATESTEMWSMDTKSISDYLTRRRISV